MQIRCWCWSGAFAEAKLEITTHTHILMLTLKLKWFRSVIHRWLHWATGGVCDAWEHVRTWMSENDLWPRFSSANCECWQGTLILWYSLFHKASSLMTCCTVEYKNWGSGVQGFVSKVESMRDDMDLKLDSGAWKPQRDQKLSRTQPWEFVGIKCDSFSLSTVFYVTLWFYYLRTLQCLR